MHYNSLKVSRLLAVAFVVIIVMSGTAMASSFIETLYRAEPSDGTSDGGDNESEIHEAGSAVLPQPSEDVKSEVSTVDHATALENYLQAVRNNLGEAAIQAALTAYLDAYQRYLAKVWGGPSAQPVEEVKPDPDPQPNPDPQPDPEPEPDPQPNPDPDPTPATGIDGRKAEMKSKYKITAVDGTAQWTERQLEEANKVLATLPASFRTCTKEIKRMVSYNGNSNVLGWVQMGIPTVHITNSACKEGTFQGTIVHEMTHTFQAKYPDVTNAWINQFWPNGRLKSSSVSMYGNTQPVEDMAESVRAYWQSGDQMKRQYPDRYEFIKEKIMKGVEY